MATTMMDMSTNVLDAIIELRRAASRAAAATFTGDVSSRQVVILRELRSSGPLSQVGLARATASDPSFIVRLLDDLEKRGLVSRQRSEADRREMVVALTPQGRKALKPLDSALRSLADAAGSELSAEEREIFIALAAKIGRSLMAIATGAATSSESRHEHR